MKHVFLALIAALGTQLCTAQITITAADMPIAGDTLRYSFASPVGSSISPADSGTSMAWNYTLSPIGQAVDTYKTALAVNPLFVVTIGATAYGYKVADSFPIPIPLPGVPSIQNLYTFFEKKSSPSRFQAQAFAANIGGIPTPINYSQPDVWYFFPLAYGNNDSSNFKLSITLPGFGSLKQVGFRKSRVDGWGTITTPFYTTATPCIRVRSEIHEVDSVQFGSFPAIGLPRNSVEYKWLVNGDHYPALWVTSNTGPGGTETVNNVRYRDNPLPDTTNAVPVIANTITEIKALPNPSANGIVTLQLPDDWKVFDIEVYDLSSKLVAVVHNNREVNIAAMPAGQYFARVMCGGNIGYAQITR